LTNSVTEWVNPWYKPIQIDPAHLEILDQQFKKTEMPFDKIKKSIVPSRKNFMYYMFVGYKLCEINGFYQYLPMFKNLKESNLINIHNMWWHAICDELGWEYIPSHGNVSRRTFIKRGTRVTWKTVKIDGKEFTQLCPVGTKHENNEEQEEDHQDESNMNLVDESNNNNKRKRNDDEENNEETSGIKKVKIEPIN